MWNRNRTNSKRNLETQGHNHIKDLRLLRDGAGKQEYKKENVRDGDRKQRYKTKEYIETETENKDIGPETL